MKQLIALLLCLSSTGLFAQEVIATEEQPITLAFILTSGFGIQVDYNVRNYAVTYTTTDAFGRPDTATGLLCVPDAAVPTVFPLLVYNHGTVDTRDGVPSVQGVQERFVAQAFAAFGFITVAPDYLGLGGDDGIHPYLHAATEASAGRDMLIAVRAWLDEQDIPRNNQVFATGYSQGGHASMALQQDLELNENTPSLTAAAHLSGPYIILPPTPQSLAISEPDPRTLRFSLRQAIAYEHVYNLYGGIDSLFREPYLSEVNRFLDDEIDLMELGVVVDSLVRANATVVGEIFTEEYVNDVIDRDPALLAAYRDNTVLDFAPANPTLLVYCNADEVVSPLNAQLALDTMRARGSTMVDSLDAGAFDHLGCVGPAVLAAVAFFRPLADVHSTSLGTPTDRADITLAPNPAPAGTLLNVSGLNAPRPYVLYDQSGRVLHSGRTGPNGQFRLPGTVPPGTLVVRIGLADGSSVVKRVVVR